jgi:hypothetical protein
MAATQLLTCPLPYAACAARRPKRVRPTLRSRLVTIAIALAVLYGMYNGERWLLEHSSASANELTVATCVVDIVFGDRARENVCAGARMGTDGEPYNE